MYTVVCYYCYFLDMHKDILVKENSLFFHFQERTHACSSALSPGRRSAVAWESSRSSSHWAATASYYSLPHQLVNARTHALMQAHSHTKYLKTSSWEMPFQWTLSYWSQEYFYVLLQYRNLNTISIKFDAWWCKHRMAVNQVHLHTEHIFLSSNQFLSILTCAIL